jgi:hypothetical protein
VRPRVQNPSIGKKKKKKIRGTYCWWFHLHINNKNIRKTSFLSTNKNVRKIGDPQERIYEPTEL